MSTNAVDLTKMSAAEIKAFIEAQPVAEVAEPVVAEQPRDENGRFVAAPVEPVAEVAETTEEVTAEPIVVEKEIDLGDGSGIQIFRGVGPTQEAAYAALVDELAKAQANATKKIQELSRKPDLAPPAETVNPENEFLLAQRIMDTPRAAIRDVLKEEFGLAPAEIKAKLAAADKIVSDQRDTELANRFMAANPDYYAAPQNGRRLERQLALEGLPNTLENLQKVYNDLKADGLITAKPTEATPIRTRSSGLSTRSGMPAPPPKAVDISKLTTEQLRELSGGYQNIYR